MSAFVVADTTINNIVSKIYGDSFRNNRYWSDQLARVTENYGKQSTAFWDQIANEFHKMNVEAVNQRYTEQEQQEPVRFRCVNVPAIQSIKSLQCFLYQCSEGDVPESALFKLLEEMSQAWMYEYIAETPEYKNASWS